MMAEMGQNEEGQKPRHHGEKPWFLDSSLFLFGYL
jgi:hypothetical protein